MIIQLTSFCKTKQKWLNYCFKIHKNLLTTVNSILPDNKNKHKYCWRKRNRKKKHILFSTEIKFQFNIHQKVFVSNETFFYIKSIIKDYVFVTISWNRKNTLQFPETGKIHNKHRHLVLNTFSALIFTVSFCIFVAFNLNWRH